MPERAENVVSRTVARGLCVGCGMCAGVCPNGNLTIRWNSHGTYEPMDGGKCGDGCGLCLSVCPFHDRDEDQDALARRLFGNQVGIEHDSELGYHLRSWAGHVESGGYRSAGASGGAATWFLVKLLDSGIVDRVICVAPTSDSECLFRFSCFDDPNDLRRSSKSAYYPVEMSEVIREVLRSDIRYACIGLPCFVKALRLAGERIPRIRQRIIVHAGLVCGQLKSRLFTELLARRLGLDVRSLDSVSFREKDPAGPASELHFQASDGAKTARLAWSNGYGECWTTGQLRIRACGFCDDVFAELADVAFMDAWLPLYMGDGRGTSIVLARTESAARVFEDGVGSGELAMSHIDAVEVIASQSDVLYDKRRALAWRLWLADRDLQSRPRTRVTARRPPLLRTCLLRVAEAVRTTSYEAMLAQRACSWKRLDVYDRALHRDLRRLRLMLRLFRARALAIAVPWAIRKRLVRRTSDRCRGTLRT